MGADKDNALDKYHRLSLGIEPIQTEPFPQSNITAKELASRFLAVQQANWRNPETTLKSYKDWLGRFLKDHPKLWVAEFTVEKFAAWKLSLQERDYSPESINHYLGAVRAMLIFAEDTGVIEKTPKLKRVKNVTKIGLSVSSKQLYTPDELQKLLRKADLQIKGMIMLALNCGFGPKDISDLNWDHIDDDRVTLPRSKTGICQTYLMWPETSMLLQKIHLERDSRLKKAAKRGVDHCDNGQVFLTRFWNPWNKTSVGHEFRKLCKETKISCYGFYRLRHCASTAMSLVATPHVQRKFMRHGQLQQQVVYTHTPDTEVDLAITKAKSKLLGECDITLNEERSPGQGGDA